MITAVAIVTLDSQMRPVKGGVVHLEAGNGELYFDITNPDGYAVFSRVPMPFVGKLKLAGSIDYYEQPISIPATSINVTIRVGGAQINPQDILLPPCSPSFKLPSTGLRDWRGAFVIPDALPGIPYGDGKRIWTPAFGIYSADWQDKILTEFVDQRGYKMFPYDPAGWIYHTDYGYLEDDSERVRRDLMKIYRRGAVPIVFACNDADGGSLEPYQSVRDNADLIKVASFMWEANGPLGLATANADGTFSGRIVTCMNNCLDAVPDADWYWHFTAGHGSIGEPERAGWRYCRDRGVVGLLSQDEGYERNPVTGDPRGTALGLVDTAERLATLGLLNVAFEQCTYAVYNKDNPSTPQWRGWTEDQQRTYGYQIRKMAVNIAGYCDGSY